MEPTHRSTDAHAHIRTLTSLHHPASHGELGGVVGCSFAPGLPGVLSHGDEMLSLFNSHLALSTFCDPLFEACTREKTGEEVTEAWTLAGSISWAGKQRGGLRCPLMSTAVLPEIGLASWFPAWVTDHHHQPWNFRLEPGCSLVCLEHQNIKMMLCTKKQRETVFLPWILQSFQIALFPLSKLSWLGLFVHHAQRTQVVEKTLPTKDFYLHGQP